jgi:hypothetical protein
VVFIREVVPRCAIALVARTFYGEKYIALRMKHEIEHLDNKLKVEYSWQRGRKWESLKMIAMGEAQAIPTGSHAEFITEHYYGYTALRNACSEYRVEHPRWKSWKATAFEISHRAPRSLPTAHRLSFRDAKCCSPSVPNAKRLAIASRAIV